MLQTPGVREYLRLCKSVGRVAAEVAKLARRAAADPDPDAGLDEARELTQRAKEAIDAAAAQRRIVQEEHMRRMRNEPRQAVFKLIRRELKDMTDAYNRAVRPVEKLGLSQLTANQH